MIQKTGKRLCEWRGQAAAFRDFATSTAATESADHIRPLHWYVSCRLVVEGGFAPDDVTPRPPFRHEKRGSKNILIYDQSVAGGGEQTILGGLKTKSVDVVVSRTRIGPVMAVSCKGVTKALRNLTNRLEETIGECTNLHITYPALVLGYLVLLRANKRQKSFRVEDRNYNLSDAAQILLENDIAVDDADAPVVSIVRFHNALREMTGRQGVREEIGRYESIGLGLVRTDGQDAGQLLETFPDLDSELNIDRFFSNLYQRYDERYVLAAPDLRSITRRFEWTMDPGVLTGLDYVPRLAEP